MNIFRKNLISIIVAALVMVFLCVPVFAYTSQNTSGRYCHYAGCNEKPVVRSYCTKHVCKYRGIGNCFNPVVKGTRFCVGHTYVGAQKTSSSSYKKSSSTYYKICSKYGCYNKVYGSGSYCSTHSSYSNNYSYKKNNNYSYKKTSSSKKYEMPDCDDYDSYDDFMDDWDGYMPDGSDAEDYWENW